MKGQAALEFLMTYGWVAMIVLIALASLSYAGLFTPKEFQPPICFMEGFHECIEWKVSPDKIELKLINNGPPTAYLSINVSSAEGTYIGNKKYTSGLENGEDTGLLQFAGSFEGKFVGKIVVEYIQSGQTVKHRDEGKIISSVEL